MLLMNKTIDSGYRSGEVCIPSSKSIVHRLMICAALGSNTVTLQLEGLSKDIRATSACLAALGAEIQLQNHSAVIKPAVTYRHPETMAVLPAGESGSTLRFLMPVVGALGRECVFKMEGRLANRPLKPFDLELMKHGMLIQQDGDHLYCSGQLQSGTFHLPGNISSQFFSGLLMALPLLPGDSCLVTEGNLESSAYIALTEDALRVAGIKVMWSDDEKCWHIPGGQRGELPEVLSTQKAMDLWQKAQDAGYVDGCYQPLLSRTRAALLADAMAERLDIREKWKVFGGLWNRRRMYKDYYQAVEQKQFLPFTDKLKQIFD